MADTAKVLLVDDREVSLHAWEAALEPLGVPTVRTDNGDDAMKIALRGGIGLILLDVRMPGISGLEVAAYLSRLDQTRHIPIILVTGIGTSALARTAIELGVADLLVKPVDPWLLRVKVNYLLNVAERTADVP
ncbi:response regulator [Streptomyces longispororuber]|uniref:response regulator n=1 Tax=Streptomyces longispororuber TaxID=68230 RepID=UPI00210EE611|nr:response regulator [Streptomyces longispororuber]MCQ4213093.1 response regulator [Streptomyces longispororuber]